MSDLQDIIAHNAHRAYEQGITRERERWTARLERIRTWNPDSHEAWIDGVLHEQDRIVALLQEIRDNWRKPTSFNYLAELDSIMAKIRTDLPTRTLQEVAAEDDQ